MPIKVTLRKDIRYFALRDIDGTERGRYSISGCLRHRGQSPRDMALKLQDKYDELKTAGKLPETFEKEWLEWLSAEIRNSPASDRIGMIFTRIENREMHAGHAKDLCP